MGIFDRWRSRSEPDEPTPPTNTNCACPEHVEDLLDVTVPPSAEFADDEPMTVGDLLECGALDVEPAGPDERWLNAVDAAGTVDWTVQEGPFHWNLWVGDEARAHYDDDADLQLDASLLEQPGVERVAWEDREVFWVGAETLCRSGVLAAAARALADPRVRQG